METERLRQFCTVVETGSLSAASEILGISNSGLSKSLKILEQELGVELLLPQGRGILVSDHGDRVYRKAKKLLEQVQGLSEFDLVDTSICKIAALEAFTHGLLPDALSKDFDNSVSQIVQLSQGELENALLENKVDVGITYFPLPQAGIEYLKIKKTRLRSYMRKSWGVEKFSQDLLYVLPFSLNSPNVIDFRDRDGWPDYKFPRSYGWQTNSLSTALNVCLRHEAAIFIPDFVANFFNQTLGPDFQLAPLDAPSKYNVTREIFLVKRSKTPENQIMKKLAKNIRKFC
jgi:DNA-binding transcriptional LysR family regulator